MKRSGIVTVAVLAVCVALGISGCGSTAATTDPGDLQGVEWRLVKSGTGSTDLSTTGITATFEGGRVGGFSGVNQYGGSYSAGNEGSLEIGKLTSTLMAGPPALMKVESAYIELLQECDSYRVEDGTLTLSTSGAETLVFEQAKEAELPGSRWVVTGFNNGEQAVVSVSIGSTLTVEFGSDGRVAGSGGVNTFSGPLESGATSITIGPLAATKMAGPPELLEQEAAYLTALENSVTWEIASGRLEMRDAEGALQITAAKP